MREDLEDVTRWMEANKLKSNVEKTQLLLLSRKQRAQKLECGDKNERPENSEEQDCEVSGSVVR